MGNSSVSQLKNRGYIQDNDLLAYNYLSIEELTLLLNSQEAFERTIAARLISNLMKDDENKAIILCERLSKENKLYTKIELCEALNKMGISSVKVMCKYLGTIGDNQYDKLPEEDFKKKSYPLPRDIISRTLAHMGKQVLPYLIEVLHFKDIKAIREVIDAIGFICFYENTDYPIISLIDCFDLNNDDVIIRWKLTRALCAFKNNAAIDLLIKIEKTDNELRIRQEAQRSLNIIKQRMK